MLYATASSENGSGTDIIYKDIGYYPSNGQVSKKAEDVLNSLEVDHITPVFPVWLLGLLVVFFFLIYTSSFNSFSFDMNIKYPQALC